MNVKKICCLGVLFVCTQFTVFSQKKVIPKNKIVIIEGPLKASSDSLTLKTYPFRHGRFDPWIIQENKRPIENLYVRWEVNTTTPILVFNNIFSRSMSYLAEPGDSIYIYHKDNEIIFSGRGAEKFRLSKEIELFIRTIKGKPEGLSDGDRESASSLEDYLAWNTYLNRKAKEWIDLLDKNKENISELSYLNLKDVSLRTIEKIRMRKFHSIRKSSNIGPLNRFGLSNEDLCRIYDSTMDNSFSKWLRFERNYVFPADYPWDMLQDEDFRRRGKFFRTNNSDDPILGEDPADKFVSIYNMIKEKYTGIARENLMAYTFYDYGGALKEVGFTPKIEAILADYYAQPGYPDFKKQVKDFELEQRGKWNRQYAPEFSLIDSKGRVFSHKRLKGKIALIDFWFTGCSGCIQMAPALGKVENHFVNDSNIVFLSISIDKNKEQWIKSVGQKKYTSGNGLQLYTGGEGSQHDVIRKFLVESYPTLEIIDQHGLFIKHDKQQIDPRRDNGKAMIEFLQKQLSGMKDGPYVFTDKSKTTIHTIDGSNLLKQEYNNKPSKQLQVQTDSRNTFSVFLKPSLETEPAEYPKPEKLFVLSDIEGNFDQFRKLLQVNGIIDENYNWTFGNGHLVFAGDMFDRGFQVTECLWLAYSLEEKAKASGGYVHFILGNHEIMNMQGYHGYVQLKYKENAALMGKTVTQLYNEESELGRWLRTKNIVEKIGDILFLHGGISRKLNQLPLTVVDINQLARPNYAIDKTNSSYGDERTNSIMQAKTSPFWYRSYYENKKEMPQIIDSTLQKFQVNQIVTGHTIVADTISIHYEGKVINIDTKHAEGRSEALLIEGDKYYRVNTQGEKILLFAKPQRYLSNKRAD